MGLKKKVGGWFGLSSKGKELSTEESATEDTIQAAIDKLSTGPKAFGNKSLSAKDAEAQLRAQGVLPQGWRLRESKSTSSGYRPTQAASKKVGGLHAGMVGAAALTGGAALGVGPLAGLSGLASSATGAGLQGGLGAAQGAATGGLKGALIGGGIGAASGGFAPGAGGAAGKAASSLGTRMAIQGGLGAAQGALSGGGLKGALRGGAVGAAAAAAPKVAPSLTKNTFAQQGINVGLQSGLNTAATGRFNPTGTAVAAGSAFLPNATGALTKNATGQRALNFAGNQGINLAASRFAGGGTSGTGGTGGGGNVRGNFYQDVMPPQTQQGTSSWGGNSLVSDDPGGGTQSWGDKWGPIIAQGGGMVAGALVGRQATKMAQQRSPEEQYALGGAQGAATIGGRAGSNFLGQSQGNMAQAGNYYSKLLTGNRALQTQAVAPGIASATDVYRGAERGYDRSGLRGAARDVATADLGRQRAGQIASLTTGVQPAAAGALGQLGAQQGTLGHSLTAQSGNLYNNLLTGGAVNREYARGEGEKTSRAIGQFSRDLGEVIGGKNKGGTTAPKKPKAPAEGGYYGPEEAGARGPVSAPNPWMPQFDYGGSTPRTGAGYGGTAPIFGPTQPPQTSPTVSPINWPRF